MVFDQYLLGGVIALLVGFLFLYGYTGKKKSTRANLMEVNSNGFVTISSNGALCRPQMEKSTDVIIVGAGVAGAALAYTLGKVIIKSLLLFLFSLIVRFIFYVIEMNI